MTTMSLSTESIFLKAASLRILVVGDLMLDEYLWGKADRISPEAPVQVVEILREEMRLGGAGNVVNNLIALGVQVDICSVVGNDDVGNLILDEFEKNKISRQAVFCDPDRKTTSKTRLLAANQQIVRIDRENIAPISHNLEKQITNWISLHIENYTVVILSDYGKGVLNPSLIEYILKIATQNNIPILIDPKGGDFKRYSGASVLTPNRKEAEIASGVLIKDNETLLAAANIIMGNCKLENLLITRSDEGMSLFLKDGQHIHIPTAAREVFDVTGAGDTVLAVLAVGIAVGLPMVEAARLANCAAGIAVGKLGTSIATPEEIGLLIDSTKRQSNSKIKHLDSMTIISGKAKQQKKRIVFTNGCFDLLHIGHIKYLEKARNMGDLLVLGLNSDASIRRLKGPKRPLLDEESRANILAALESIDYVVIFEEDTPDELIKAIRPDVLVKGGDYTREEIVGRSFVESYGGKVELIPLVDGKSTTNIIERVLDLYSNNLD